MDPRARDDTGEDRDDDRDGEPQRRARDDALLPDGTYDVFVVWADESDEPDEAGAIGEVALDLAITTGPHKGDVVEVRARGLVRTALDLVGIPCTLVVEGGRPRVEL